MRTPKCITPAPPDRRSSRTQRISITTGCVLSCLASSIGKGSPLPFYTDVTSEAGLQNAVHGTPPGLPEEIHDMSGGGAIADFNRDGFQDILFLSGGVGPDKLFINNRDGSFTDRAAEWGLDELPRHIGIGALASDINNDGYPDVFVTSLGPSRLGGRTGHHRLLVNSGPDHEGRFSFRDRAAEAGVARVARFIPDGFGSALGDIDLDGDLDLAIAGWYPIGHNALFRNDTPKGRSTPSFTNITRAAIDSEFQPSDASAPGLNNYGFSPRIIDTDGDWHPDIVWVSDFGQSRYLRNNTDGTFTDITENTGTGLDQNGMGVTQGDLNNDGRPDFAVSAIFQSTYFAAARDGNRLYINTGAHTFNEIAAPSGSDDGGWGWGIAALDVDHDGDLDLAGTNGWPGFNEFVGEHNDLWVNQFTQTGTLSFIEQAAQTNFDLPINGRALARLDYDNDGDQDILLTESQGSLRLLRSDLITENEQPHDANWIRVFIDTEARVALAPEGIGARVTATVHTDEGTQTQTRWIDAGPNYLMNSERSAHFGVGPSTIIERLDIEFHDGTLVRFNDIHTNQTLQVQVPPCRADITVPLGLHDLADIVAFIELYMDDHRAADLAPPRGVLDQADMAAFVELFNQN